MSLIQPAYSLLKCDIEKDLLPLCQREHIGVVPYQVLQGGMLTGKYRRGQEAPKDSRHAEKPEWTQPLTDAIFDTLEEYQREAQAKGRSLTQHALQSLLEQPGVVSLIVGVKRDIQLDQLTAAVQTG